MADFFTLNPRYERYELGVYPLEYKTVYGVERRQSGHALVGAIFVMAVNTLLFIYTGGTSGRNSNRVIDLFIIFALIVCAIWVIPTEVFSLVRTLRINKSYKRLVRNGILIDGQIFEIRVREQKTHVLESWLYKPQTKGLYFIDYIYKFTSPDEHLIFGNQTIVRPYKYLNDQILPPDGTPIRVLYADDNTHVML